MTPTQRLLEAEKTLRTFGGGSVHVHHAIELIRQVRESLESPDDDTATQQNDLRKILEALGLSTSARAYSCHEVVQRDVLPAIAALAGPPPENAHRMRRMLLNIEHCLRSMLTDAQRDDLGIGAGTDLDMAVLRVLSRLGDLEAAAASPLTRPEGDDLRHVEPDAAESAAAVLGPASLDQLQRRAPRPLGGGPQGVDRGDDDLAGRTITSPSKDGDRAEGARRERQGDGGHAPGSLPADRTERITTNDSRGGRGGEGKTSDRS